MNVNLIGSMYRNKNTEIQNLMIQSYKCFFSEDFIEGSITFSDGSDKAADGENGGFSQVDGTIIVKVADVELD